MPNVISLGKQAESTIFRTIAAQQAVSDKLALLLENQDIPAPDGRKRMGYHQAVTRLEQGKHARAGYRDGVDAPLFFPQVKGSLHDLSRDGAVLGAFHAHGSRYGLAFCAKGTNVA